MSRNRHRSTSNRKEAKLIAEYKLVMLGVGHAVGDTAMGVWPWNRSYSQHRRPALGQPLGGSRSFSQSLPNESLQNPHSPAPKLVTSRDIVGE